MGVEVRVGGCRVISGSSPLSEVVVVGSEEIELVDLHSAMSSSKIGRKDLSDRVDLAE